MTVKTRVAPSPTGDPHVGTGYAALFNYCLAKAMGGKFVLRIEDTDQVRSTAASEANILRSLRWLGIEWDEGPDVGGPCGPYRQSERSEIYASHTRQLLDSGHAFRCFCTPERLAALRDQQRQAKGAYGYDGHCLGLDSAEVSQRVEGGESHVVRLRVPREGTCVIEDVLRGSIEIPWHTVDMQVLLKSDGLPTYHMANVVDDHLMGITHVLRGEEWINSAPKHILLYQAFGWAVPVLCHLPLLRNPDKSKLSKRKNPTSMLWYEAMGYPPEALLNYLGHMAFSMPDDRDKFNLADMAAVFEMKRISLGGPVFDLAKLDSLAGRWVREELTDAELLDRYVDWALDRDRVLRVLSMARPRVQKYSDLIDLVQPLLAGTPTLQPEQLVSNQMDADAVVRALQFAVWQWNGVADWNKDAIEDGLRQIGSHLDLKLRVFLRPFYVAITGRTTSLPLFDTIELLGRDVARDRVRRAIDVLGGVGKKKLRKLEKAFAAMD